jgi:hypothetical protein
MGDSPTLYKLELGAALQRFRERAGLERADAAATLSCSTAKIRTIEVGAVGIVPAELRALLDRYEVAGSERADVEHLAEQARQRRPRTPWGSAIPDRLRPFFATEETAVAIQAYQPWLLHGLAQTERYAHAVLSTNSSLTPQNVERLVQARMARQARLASENPPRLTLVIDEQVLHRTAGSADVMREQLEHLSKLGSSGAAEVRIIPSAVGVHPGSGIPFLVLTPAGDRKRVVYVETYTDGLFVDEPERVERHETAMREMLELALSPEESLSLVDTVSRQL